MSKELSVRLNGLEVGILKLTNGKMEFTYNNDAKKPLSLDISSKLVKAELQKQKQSLPNIIKEIAAEINCEIGYKISEYVSKQSC